MKHYLLAEHGSFYKANLHCHTNISDGKMSPEEVKEWYKSHGYSAVCYTDHEVLIDQSALCDDEFVALHGYEVSIKQDPTHHTGIFMPVHHLNLLAEKQDDLRMPRFFKNNPSMPGNARKWAEEKGQYDPDDVIDATEYSIEWLNDYLTAVQKAGFLITYNHPQWSLQSAADLVRLKGLHAIEVINGGCIFLNDNTSLYFEQMLRAGMDVVPVGGDDNHHSWEMGRAWTMIKAEALTYDALIKAYKNGDCYTSEGPSIEELYIEDGEVVVKCSPVTTVCMLSEGRACGVRASETGDLTEARFPYRPEGYGRYFRLELRDATGKKAFSRAYKTAEI
jgi:predicted metal-dependent phosphoesterase TrpH